MAFAWDGGAEGDAGEEGDFVEGVGPVGWCEGGEAVCFEEDEAAHGGDCVAVFGYAVLGAEGVGGGVPGKGFEVGFWEEVDVGVHDGVVGWRHGLGVWVLEIAG